MKKKKFICTLYRYFTREELIALLEQMARQGWMVTRYTRFGLWFKPVPPVRLHFDLVYFPDMDQGGKYSQFRDMCEHMGWQLAARRNQTLIFSHPGPDPVPLEDDPVTQVEAACRVIRREHLPYRLSHAAIALLYTLLNLWEMSIDPGRFLSSSSELVLLSAWVAAGVYHLVGAVHLLLWCRRARRSVARGEPAAERVWYGSDLELTAILLLCSMLFLSGGTSPIFVGPACVLLALGVLSALLALAGRWRDALRRKQVLRRLPALLAFFAAYAILFLVAGTAFGLTESPVPHRVTRPTQDGDTVSIYDEQLPLSVPDLIQTEHTAWSSYCYTSTSPLLTQTRAYQRSYLEGETHPELDYTVVSTPYPLLYDLCLDDTMSVFAENPNYLDSGHPDWKSREIVDPAPWGAQAAWQQYLGTGDQRRAQPVYLLCYDTCIVTIRFENGWTLTPRIMAAVGQTLGS